MVVVITKAAFCACVSQRGCNGIFFVKHFLG